MGIGTIFSAKEINHRGQVEYMTIQHTDGCQDTPRKTWENHDASGHIPQCEDYRSYSSLAYCSVS